MEKDTGADFWGKISGLVFDMLLLQCLLDIQIEMLVIQHLGDWLYKSEVWMRNLDRKYKFYYYEYTDDI